jgi:hypothetical protein
MSTQLTVETVKSACPHTLRNSINQDFVNKLNQMHTDPLVRDELQSNALGYISVLTEGRFKVDDYLNAVKFVTYRLSGATQQESYTKTFPDRHKKFMMDGLSAKEISAYVTMYAKNKLVTLMMERAMIPVWLVNADNYQKAINTQVELMMTAKSEMVRATAANSVLTHLKQPETAKIDVNIHDETQASAIDELRKATQKLADQQEAAIRSGQHNAKDIAHSDILEAEYVEQNS